MHIISIHPFHVFLACLLPLFFLKKNAFSASPFITFSISSFFHIFLVFSPVAGRSLDAPTGDLKAKYDALLAELESLRAKPFEPDPGQSPDAWHWPALIWRESDDVLWLLLWLLDIVQNRFCLNCCCGGGCFGHIVASLQPVSLAQLQQALLFGTKPWCKPPHNSLSQAT
jgi:hypothetical protein